MTGWREQEYGNHTRSRETNETIERASAELGDGVGTEIFVCECGDFRCTSEICLTLTEYEEVRADPTHFAIARDHEDPESELVVWENERWAIVEAIGREALMAAREATLARSEP